ncbi:MAG: MBL fold metallo-hydrolase [Candidatus Hermodarchaeota archaeon]
MEEERGGKLKYNETKTSESYISITYNNVNCYLVKTNNGFVLIDTGFSKDRTKIEKELESAGCKVGDLKLIVVTHGDGDHVGNCAYFREKYSTRIAMHSGDRGMVEYGDFLWNRKVSFPKKILFKILTMLLSLSGLNLKKSDQFKPDIYIKDGDNLSEYGLDAKVLHTPGHSKGSVGYLLPNGDLFCGDLLMNTKEPAKFSMIVEHQEFNSSIEKLKRLKIRTVYPGHGKPFSMKQYIENHKN